MVFDLGAAMRKKAAFETARLMDFDFRRRARATRMLAESLGIADHAATLTATCPEAEPPARIAALTGRTAETVAADYARMVTVAHAELVRELGDPTPHRLA